MIFLEHRDSANAGYEAGVAGIAGMADKGRGNPLSIQHPSAPDALAVKAIMDQNAPESRYASYYYAMNFLFLPNTSLVARDGSGDIIGAFVGLYDFTFKKLIVSHIAASLSLAAEQAAFVKTELVGHVFANAVNCGLEEISAHLDTAHDPVIDNALNVLSRTYDIRSSVAFNNAASSAANGALHMAKPDAAAVDMAGIVYRHPVEGDAAALWSLVLKINQESGGLDIYALSNYQRLCRDLPETCMVAEHQGNIVGFATGFMMPNQHEKGLFLWQTGVHPDYHGKGIGSKVETLLIDRHKPDYLNFTVEASNGAANRTAEKKAEYMRAGYTKTGDISSENLGGGHEPEVIYYVGAGAKLSAPAGPV